MTDQPLTPRATLQRWEGIVDWKLIGRTAMAVLLVVVVSEVFDDIPSEVLAVHYAKGKPLRDAIEELRSASNIFDPLEDDYPAGVMEEDKYIFNDRYAEYFRERIEELEELEVKSAQQSKEADVAEIIAARKRRIGFAPD